MIINLNEKELSKCYKLLETKEENLSAVEFLIEYLNFHARDITNSDIEKLSKRYTLEESFVKAMKKHMNIKDNDEEYNEIDKVCKISSVSKLDVNEFESNPYYKKIGNVTGSEQGWKFMKLSYDPFEGFVSDEIEVDEEYYAEHTPFSFFDTKFEFLSVVENDEIWMSIMPHEINTMKGPINNAKGRVLVLGLGLGYYLYMILNKKDVTQIDVVEKDPRVIKLFNSKLIEKFPHQEKFNIIFDDALEYLTRTGKKYDYVFGDIWHNVGDGESLYIKLKNLEYKQPGARFDYWIEKSILAMLRRQTLTVFEEALAEYDENEYKMAKNDNDKIINEIYRYHKKTSITSFDDLHQILSDENLRKMAAKLKLN